MCEDIPKNYRKVGIAADKNELINHIRGSFWFQSEDQKEEYVDPL